MSDIGNFSGNLHHPPPQQHKQIACVVGEGGALADIIIFQLGIDSVSFISDLLIGYV